MALRIKNMSRGWVYGGKFHPERDADDYDPSELSDRALAKESKATQASVLGVRYRPAARRKKKATGRKGNPKARAHRSRSRTKSPITTKWVTSKVRRVGNDIQVMLFPKGKVAKRRAKRRVVRRRTTRSAVRRKR